MQGSEMEELKARPANSFPLTPLTFLERAATIYGDCLSIIFNTTTFTWSQTLHRCLRLASSLSSLGIQRGDIVSVMAPNVPAMYELQFAVPMAGAVLNSINTRLDAHTVSVILSHAESKLVFVDQQFVPLVLDAVSLVQIPKPTLVLIADEDVSPEFSAGGEFVDDYEGLVKKGDRNFKWVRPRSDYEPLALNYTSGTTSAPKGVVIGHKGAFIMSVDSLIEWSVPKNPVYLWTLPLFHANGWSFSWGMAAVGGTNICLRKFDGPMIYNIIERHRITHLCAAPIVLNMLTNSSATTLKNPVHILTAGAPPPAAVIHRASSLGFKITHGYGMTETGGIVISCTWKPEWNSLPASEQARLKARQGVKTIGLTEADVVDPATGKSVKRDGLTLGEVVLRGGSLMLGYLKDPKATSNCMTEDGWLYTGDVAVMHPDGYLEIKDRSKDIIISGGENVSSVEVESVLYANPAVNEAAVVARPDDYWGETPCAFVSLKGEMAEKPSEKDIMEYCKEKLPRYMVPKTVVIKEELPKTATGKIQKFALREIARGMGPVTRVSRL